MADILSYKQTKSLINTINKKSSIEHNLANKTVREYDFKSPKKFTKDRIKLLDSVYENFSRATSSYLSMLLRYPCEIKVANIEEQRYSDFSNDIDNTGVISILSISSEIDSSINGNIILDMPKVFAYNVIDRALGGIGGIDKIDKNFTDIELSLYESIISKLAPRMNDSWRNHVEVDIEFEKSEPNAELIQFIALDEIVVIIELELSTKLMRGIVKLCVPTSILEGIFKVYDKQSLSMNRRKDVKYEKYDKEILNSLRVSDLDVVAVLGNTQIELHDIYDLKVGDVIQIDKDKESDVDIKIGNKVWFEGSLGLNKQNLAVKINKVCY